MSEQLQAIRTALQYIEDHLHDEIAVADIAAATGYSLYHFIRTFNQAVHHTPYDYLMRRRLSEAARALLDSNDRIIDIALDFQFNNHETFSRAFKRMFDTQPTQWREVGRIPRRSLIPALTMAHLKHISKESFLQPVLVDRDETHLIGLMIQGRENIPHLWASLRQALEGIPLKAEMCSYFGVTLHPQIRVGNPFFMGAVEVASLENIPPTLISQTLPAGSYIRFIYSGSEESLHLTLDYFYHTWLPKSDYRVAHPLEIECFGSDVSTEVMADLAIYIPVEQI
jgi:AraC family transcriptional regulator